MLACLGIKQAGCICLAVKKIKKHSRRSSAYWPRRRSTRCAAPPLVLSRPCSWTWRTSRPCPGTTSPRWRTMRWGNVSGQKLFHHNVEQAQAQEEERRIPSPDSTQQSLVAVEASAHSGRMDSTEEMMETCSRANQASSINSSRRSSMSQSLVESNLRQRATGNIVSCPTYNWHQPDFSA